MTLKTTQCTSIGCINFHVGRRPSLEGPEWFFLIWMPSGPVSTLPGDTSFCCHRSPHNSITLLWGRSPVIDPWQGLSFSSPHSLNETPLTPNPLIHHSPSVAQYVAHLHVLVTWGPSPPSGISLLLPFIFSQGSAFFYVLGERERMRDSPRSSPGASSCSRVFCCAGSFRAAPKVYFPPIDIFLIPFPWLPLLIILVKDFTLPSSQ